MSSAWGSTTSDAHCTPKPAAWLSAALLGFFAPSVSAQYGFPDPGITGGRAGSPPVIGGPGQTLPYGVGRRVWEVRPTLAVEETYTDNVRLRPAGQEQSDWVTLIRPSISITRDGPRARWSATYAPQLVYRANEGTKDIYHYLNAAGTVDVVPQLFFVDANAAVTQTNTSLLGPQAQSNVNNPGNRTSIRSYSLSPYLRRDFGYSAQGEARLTHDEVSYGGGNTLFNSESNRVDMRLTSGPAYKLLTWKLEYFKERIEYTQTHQTLDMERIFAGGKRLITANTAVLANAGYEDNSFLTTGPAPKGAFWSVGPEWTPTPRTRLAATVGHRYFGTTYFLDFSHRSRLTTWRLQYDEDVTTTRGQFLVPVTASTAQSLDALLTSQVADPAARAALVRNVITQTGLPETLTIPLNFLSTAPFLQKRLHGSFGITGVRNTVLADVFRQDREALNGAQLGAGDFALSQNTKQTGGSVVWTHRISALTTSNLTASYTLNQFPGFDRQDHLKVLQASLIKQFQPRLTGSVTFRRLQNNSNQSLGSYKENAITVALLMRF